MSPADDVVSLGWLILPEDWDPELTYPLYVHLHGLWSPYQNPVDYMSFYLRPDSITNKSFEDGYFLLPWGRGNIWYKGIGETDVLEAVDNLDTILHINPRRKYLIGHSMGGFGVWSIAQKNPQRWTALGIYAGALWYDSYALLNAETAAKLKNIPVYFVCGDQDGLLRDNQTAYQLLEEAGNPNIFITSFHGGHESLLTNWQNMYQWLQNWESDSLNRVSDRNKEFPMQFKLYGNYPNPFNPSTTISYSLNRDTRVKIEIFNLAGQRIAEPADRIEPAGIHSLQWNAENLSSGIYFCRMTAGDKNIFHTALKMILAK
jgi:hypothetical protein